RPVCGGQGCGMDKRRHRRDDRADCPVPVDPLHEQCSADPDLFSRGQSREGSLTRGALLWRGEGWRILSSASTSRPRPRTARRCSSTASGRLTKEHASVDEWLKDIAPSAGLRTWFGLDPNRWREFRKRCFEELRANHAAVEYLTDLVSAGKVT